MATISHGALGRLFSVLMLTITLAACGGGSSSGGGTNPPPAPAEFLFASGTSQAMSFKIDTNTGVLSQTASVTEPDNTVGVAVTPSASFVYVSDKGAGIDGLSVGQNGSLLPVPGSPWPGPTNYYGGGMAMDPGGKFIYATSGYGPPGFVAGFTINGTTGALAAIPGSPFSMGVDPVQATIDGSGKFIYVADMLDAQGGIFGYGIDPSTGVLVPMSGSPFPTLPNAEPSGVVAVPSGKFVYASLFSLNSVAAFTADSSTGALIAVPGSPFATEADPASLFYSITVDPSGKFVFGLSAAFTGSTISVFTIDPTSGALTLVSGSPFTVENGAISGGLAVDPSGKFLYIAGGNASEIMCLSIDGTTGALTSTGSSFALGVQFPVNLSVAVVP
jgi:6-phosphogluconolactonase (cycloisomerase 2 family)